MTTRVVLLSAFTAVTAYFASTAMGDVVVNVTEMGGDVLFNGHGDIDLTGLDLAHATVPSRVKPNESFTVGPSASTSVDVYQGTLSGPAEIGIGTTSITATSGTGDTFGLFFTGNFSLVVPDGYSSGATLSGTSNYAGETLSSLGIASGTYIWSFGENTIQLNVGVVPEPSGILLTLMGAGAACFWRGRSRNHSTR